MAEEDIAVEHLTRLSPKVLQRRPVTYRQPNKNVSVAVAVFVHLCLLYFTTGLLGGVEWCWTMPYIGQIGSYPISSSRYFGTDTSLMYTICTIYCRDNACLVGSA